MSVKKDIADLEQNNKDFRSAFNDQIRNVEYYIEQQICLAEAFSDFLKKRAQAEEAYCRSIENAYEKFHRRIVAGSNSLLQENFTKAVELARTNAKRRLLLSAAFSDFSTPLMSAAVIDTRKVLSSCKDHSTTIMGEVNYRLNEVIAQVKKFYSCKLSVKNKENKLHILKKELEKFYSANDIKKAKAWEKNVEKKQAEYDDAALSLSTTQNELVINQNSLTMRINTLLNDDNVSLAGASLHFLHHSSRASLASLSELEHYIATYHLEELDSHFKSVDENLTAHLLQNEIQNAVVNKKWEPHRPTDRLVKCDNICARYKYLKDNEDLETFTKADSDFEKCLENYHINDLDSVSFLRGKKSKEQLKSQWQIGEHHGKLPQYWIISRREHHKHAGKQSLMKAVEELYDGKVPQASVARLRRHSRVFNTKQLKFAIKPFGSDIDEYCRGINEFVPPIVVSCANYIVDHDIYSVGIFRISGSKTEISRIQASFEEGEDPLAQSSHDINTVADTLKLYIRQLKPPLLHDEIFHRVMTAFDSCSSNEELVGRLREIATGFSDVRYATCRYLFAFLNHVSKFSDENNMDAYNLSVCFAPTVMPISSPEDLVNRQTAAVESIKVMIVHHAAVFSSRNLKDAPIFNPDQEDSVIEDDASDAGGDADSPQPDLVADLPGKPESPVTPPVARVDKLRAKLEQDKYFMEGITNDPSQSQRPRNDSTKLPPPRPGNKPSLAFKKD